MEYRCELPAPRDAIGTQTRPGGSPANLQIRPCRSHPRLHSCVVTPDGDGTSDTLAVRGDGSVHGRALAINIITQLVVDWFVQMTFRIES
jgi:hypothetical protein